MKTETQIKKRIEKLTLQKDELYEITNSERASYKEKSEARSKIIDVLSETIALQWVLI